MTRFPSLSDRFRRSALLLASLLGLGGAVRSIAAAQLASSLPAPATEQARYADDFVSSMGVGIHPPSFPYQKMKTVYADKDLVKARLAELGIRHYRADARDIPSDWPFFRDLYRTCGMKADLLFTSNYWTWPRVTATLKEYAEVIESVEGPNETDCHKYFLYQGVGFPEGVVAYHNTLHDIVKGEAATKDVTIIAPSVCGPPKNAPKLIGCQIDLENMHSYPLAHVPTWGLDDGYAYRTGADAMSANRKPIVATETGYYTGLASKTKWQRPVSETAQGKYLPRLFGEYWNRGIVRTYIYELFDEKDDPSDLEANFGLVRNDGTPKPAFLAIKSLIALLKDPVQEKAAKSGEGVKPKSLSYTLTGGGKILHHTLLQKRNGDFYLLLWQDVSTYDIDAQKDMENADVEVTIRPMQAMRSAQVYRYNAEGRLTPEDIRITNGTIKVGVPDTVLILKLTPASLTALRRKFTEKA